MDSNTPQRGNFNLTCVREDDLSLSGTPSRAMGESTCLGEKLCLSGFLSGPVTALLHVPSPCPRFRGAAGPGSVISETVCGWMALRWDSPQSNVIHPSRVGAKGKLDDEEAATAE